MITLPSISLEYFSVHGKKCLMVLDSPRIKITILALCIIACYVFYYCGFQVSRYKILGKQIKQDLIEVAKDVKRDIFRFFALDRWNGVQT